MISSVAFMGVISLIINSIYNNILLKYKIQQFIFDLMPGVLVSICIFIIIEMLSYIKLRVQYLFLLNIISCGLFYLFLILFKIDSNFLLINKSIYNLILKNNN